MASVGGVEDVVESKEWFLTAYQPDGVPNFDHLKLRTKRLSLTTDSIPDGHLVVELLYISVDPYVRTRITGHQDSLSFPSFALNEVISAFGIGKVIISKDSKFTRGDIVTNPFAPVAEYYVAPASSHRKIDSETGIPLLNYLGSLGVPGFTAWVGMEMFGDVKEGSNVFISAAAGGVGIYAGQLAKIKGCRVIGSTGSDDKVMMLKEEFGYDDAFNYHKETDFDAALNKYFQDGIDIYFDNVGGKMLEAVLNHVNKGASIYICGMISQYNKNWKERYGVRNLLNIVGKEVKMQGFLIGSYLDRFEDFSKQMKGYIREGKIIPKQKIYFGIENYSECFASIFSSSNNAGKVVIQLKPLS